MSSDKSRIPVYSIDRFNPSGLHSHYQIEVFDKNRNFKVQYPHRHDFYEILFITQGSGTHTIDYTEYQVKPDSIFFLSPGQVHTLNLSDDILGYIFLFTSEFYQLGKQDKNQILELPFFYSLAENASAIYLQKQEDVQKFTDLFTNAIKEQKEFQNDSAQVIRALLEIILINCKRHFPLQTDEKNHKGKMMVKKFKQLIEEKYRQNLSVKDYADLLNITSSHLSETVKNITGRTPTDHINDKMIIEIKRMLLHTDLSITEIAYELKFADQSYFSRYFRKVTGMSPGEFRVIKN